MDENLENTTSLSLEAIKELIRQITEADSEETKRAKGVEAILAQGILDEEATRIAKIGDIGEVSVKEFVENKVTPLNTKVEDLSARAAENSSDIANCKTRISRIEDTAEKLSAATIVETFHSEDSWYRVWSDGWVEQGGITLTNSTVGQKPVITLPIEMSSDVYNINFHIVKGGNSNDVYNNVRINAPFTTSTTFQYYVQPSMDTYTAWSVCGMKKV